MVDDCDRKGEEGGCLLQRLKIVLPHLGLVMLCIAYTLAGAVVFYWIERPHEEATRQAGISRVLATKAALLRDLYDLALLPDVRERQWKDA